MSDPLGLFGNDNSNDPLGLDPLGLFEKKKPQLLPDDTITKSSAGMRGVAEAGVGMLAGLPSQIAGGLYGLGTYLSGQGIDKASENVKKVQESNFGFGAYQAPTEEGRYATEKLGEAMLLPGKTAGYVGQKVGGDLGEFVAQTTTDMAMNFLPIAGAKAAKGSVKDFAKKDAPRGPNLDLINQETAPKPLVDTPQLPKQSPMERIASDLGAEPQVPATPDTPMTRMAQNLTEASTPEQRAAQAALDARQVELELAIKKQTTLDMNASERQRQEAASNVSELHKRWEDQKEQLRLAQDSARMKDALNGELFDTPEQGYGPNPYDIGGKQHWTVDENGIPIRADLTMEAQNLENPLQRNIWGDELAQKHEQENPVSLTAAIDSMPSQPWKGDARDQALSLFGDETLMHSFGDKMMSEEQRKAVGTALKTGATNGEVKLAVGMNNQHATLTAIPGLKARLGDIKPDFRSPDQFIKEEGPKNLPDVNQNFAQKAANYFTKGGQHQVIKTQNPVIKYVVDNVTEAMRTAKGEITAIVHDKLAPAARALDRQEKADVWAAQVIAEQNKKPLTRDMMERAGFNEKQIAWVETHNQVMKDMLVKLNEATKAAGMEPVSPRVAYLASRATGDFRTLLYKEVNGERVPVAILGANTRGRLKSDLAKLQAAHPEWIPGEERFFGGASRHGSADMTALMDLLAKNNPDVALLADHVNEILTKDAFSYMNAKSHTMEKKGISGMVGRKELSDMVENATDGMQAQINYAERMIEWSNLSKAVEQIKPILKSDNGLNMPNAKEWSNKYLQRALGNNPGAVGKAIDNAFAEAFGKAGVGPSVIRRSTAQARSFVNGLLLGWGNVMFIGMNLIQPMVSMPGMAAFLRGRNVSSGALGYSYLAKSMNYAWKSMSDSPVPPVIRDAFKYANEKHVYSSDLFDSNSRVNENASSFWEKGTQFGAAQAEMRTRQVAFLSYVQILHDAGFKKGDGLYETAHNLTDEQMNNYARHEMPSFYSEITGNTLGSNAANLMSYKHNEYSRLAMFAREMKQSGTAIPLVTQLASSVAFAGVLGTIGYSEADALVKALSKAYGKPTSLTKVLLDNPDIPDMVKGGVGTAVGADLTSRLGTGPMVAPNLIDAVAPGAGKLVNIGSAGYDLAKNRDEFSAKNFVRELAPNSITGMIDRAWFSKNNPQGEEMGINRNTGKALVTRNAADIGWKSVSGTGWNESQQKSRLWENQQIDMAYADKRKSLLEKAQKNITLNGSVPEDFAKKYLAAQGDPNSLEREIVKMYVDGSIDKVTAQKLLLSGSASITSTHKLLRLLGEE